MTVDTDTGKPKFTATYHLHWSQPDPVALGVEVEEEISASPNPMVVSIPVPLSYQCRTRQPDDPPGEGLQVRSQDVAFHDVQIRSRVRAIGGWDRISPSTAFTPWPPLVLYHEPAAPNLAAPPWQPGMHPSLAR